VEEEGFFKIIMYVSSFGKHSDFKYMVEIGPLTKFFLPVVSIRSNWIMCTVIALVEEEFNLEEASRTALSKVLSRLSCHSG
jgi:hypothetical protein